MRALLKRLYVGRTVASIAALAACTARASGGGNPDSAAWGGGARHRRISDGSSSDSNGSWSPRGDRIAFVSDREGGQLDPAETWPYPCTDPVGPADGDHLWIYDPELEQVTVRNQSQEEQEHDGGKHQPLATLRLGPGVGSTHVPAIFSLWWCG